MVIKKRVLGVFILIGCVIGVYGVTQDKAPGLNMYDYSALMFFGIGIVLYGSLPERMGRKKQISQ